MIAKLQSDPLVSIMIPVYNGEDTLLDAIASIVKQSYLNWECVIVNDGSVDRTRSILESIRDDRFKVISLAENKGRPYARQIALDNCTGELLAFLDADDMYHPDKIKLQVEVFIKHSEVDLVSCFMGSFNLRKELENVRGVAETRVNTVLEYKFTGSFEAPHAASMTRLKYSKNTGYNNALKYGQDSDFFIRYLMNRKYYVVNEIMYYYSEYESVTVSKIIQTYYYNVVKLKPFLINFFFPALKSMWLNVAKLIFTVVASLFVQKDYFVRRRGRHANINEREAFGKFLENLHGNNSQ